MPHIYYHISTIYHIYQGISVEVVESVLYYIYNGGLKDDSGHRRGAAQEVGAGQAAPHGARPKR